MDIAEQLVGQAKEIADAGHNGWGNTMTAAADEIERLRAALEKIASRTQSDQLLWWQKVAREALVPNVN